MPKITLTADEELMYLNKLDRLQELMPDLEIEVVTQPFISRIIPSNIGEEFKQFLRKEPKTTVTVQAFK